jgi:hypothetical protein
MLGNEGGTGAFLSAKDCGSVEESPMKPIVTLANNASPYNTASGHRYRRWNKLALDSGAAGDCRRCGLVLHKKEKRHDDSLRGGRSGPHGDENDYWSDHDQHDDPTRRSQRVLL